MMCGDVDDYKKGHVFSRPRSLILGDFMKDAHNFNQQVDDGYMGDNMQAGVQRPPTLLVQNSFLHEIGSLETFPPLTRGTVSTLTARPQRGALSAEAKCAGQDEALSAEATCAGQPLLLQRDDTTALVEMQLPKWMKVNPYRYVVQFLSWSSQRVYAMWRLHGRILLAQLRPKVSGEPWESPLTRGLPKHLQNTRGRSREVRKTKKFQ